MDDVIVIGGGPAGLAAAFFATGKGLKVVLICDELGGKVGWLQSLVGPNHREYLPGNDVVQTIASRATKQARQVIYDRATRLSQRDMTFEVTTTQHGTLQALTVIVAAGADTSKLTVPGADRFVDHGLDTSATTHAHLVAGQHVAVIGSTVRALAGAAELARTAARVYVVTAGLAGPATMLADAVRQRPNVEMIEGYTVIGINGDAAVTDVLIARDGEIRRLPVQRAFACLGLLPNSDLVRGLAELDPQGFIVVDERYATTVPGLFAAGDVSTRIGENVMLAIGDGARAAASAYQHILAHWLVLGDTPDQDRRPVSDLHPMPA
jgi:thioredoxin reductase